ncbi:MAG TPA: hypothetical protein VIU37_12090 [Candidatus Limnocylindrales bacterium]
MTRRLAGAVVAGAFALGLAAGAAGTIAAHDTTAPRTDFDVLMADHMAGYDMGSMMSGSMMGPGSSFGPGMMSGLGGSSMPDSLHDLHHPTATPDAPK